MTLPRYWLRRIFFPSMVGTVISAKGRGVEAPWTEASRHTNASTNRIIATFKDLSYLILDFFEPVGTLQHIARTAAVGWSDDSVALHHVENSRRASITEAQAALQRGCGRLAHLAHHADRLLVQGIFHAVDFPGFALFVVRRRRDQERLVVLRLGLL